MEWDENKKQPSLGFTQCTPPYIIANNLAMNWNNTAYNYSYEVALYADSRHPL